MCVLQESFVFCIKKIEKMTLFLFLGKFLKILSPFLIFKLPGNIFECSSKLFTSSQLIQFKLPGKCGTVNLQNTSIGCF